MDQFSPGTTLAQAACNKQLWSTLVDRNFGQGCLETFPKPRYFHGKYIFQMVCYKIDKMKFAF